MSGIIHWDWGLFQLKDQAEGDDDDQAYVSPLGAWRCRANHLPWSDEQIDAFLRLEYHRTLRDEFERDARAERESYLRVAQAYHGTETTAPLVFVELD